ncbi:MAG: toxin-antitoxin system HicB family antitoxin [Leptospiraceae bacterium]|nr:toxin-antitoxin system HicB family antitoxin [Leptospiraceae bacterium]MBK7054313.1 toxin-antitoxin system HicB family antitoxin [Leptospiraceae bacterium]MBK9499566.1 toxin-antitoxin system HicB family antitoxin [Leptospiraceae bacterium]MBL0266638.1 toxin-antitoxin system HicB family antitoxin [Leptospiraceae bacterium]
MSKKNVLTIRIPEDLKDRLERTASAQGVSLNQFALYAFTRGLNDVETAQFFKKRIAGKTNESLEKNFDKVMKKVKTRKTQPEWDKLESIEIKR